MTKKDIFEKYKMYNSKNCDVCGSEDEEAVFIHSLFQKPSTVFICKNCFVGKKDNE